MLALSVYSKDDDVENGGKFSDPSEKFRLRVHTNCCIASLAYSKQFSTENNIFNKQNKLY